jgi:hypothetical protein
LAINSSLIPAREFPNSEQCQSPSTASKGGSGYRIGFEEQGLTFIAEAVLAARNHHSIFEDVLAQRTPEFWRWLYQDRPDS